MSILKATPGFLCCCLNFVILAQLQLPRPVSMIDFNTKADGESVTFLFWTRANLFGVEYYPQLKAAYELMEELKNTTIVVKKKR